MHSHTLRNDDALLPGDVVLDMANHRPMQVTGYDTRPACDVEEVWESETNHEYFDIDSDERVIELVDVPTGSHYYVPEDIRLYPRSRLGRLVTESATGDRRVQEKLVRVVMAHIIADLRELGCDNAADDVTVVVNEHWDDEYVSDIVGLSETVSSVVGD